MNVSTWLSSGDHVHHLSPTRLARHRILSPQMMKLFSAFSSFILTYYVKYHHPNTIRHSVKLNYIGNFDHKTSMALLYMFICIFAITFLGCALGADSI